MDSLRPPLGIKVICVILALFGILNIIQVVQIAVSIPLSARVVLPAGVITALSVGYVIVSVGLWKGRSWAWKGAIALVAVGGFSALIQGIVGFPIVVLMGLIGVYLFIRRELFLTSTAAA